MSDIIWEIYQQGKVAGAVADAKHAVSKAYESNTNSDGLAKKLERLALLNQAVWSLVKQRTSLTDQDLLVEIKRLDLLDGQMDGKLTETKTCVKCHTTLMASAQSCYRCRTQSPITSAFHGL